MNNYDHLDLCKVKKKICQYTSIKEASDYIINEEVIFNPLVIKSKLKDTKEALDLLKKGFVLSFDGILNINDLFLKATKDICLDSYELSLVAFFSNHCLRIKKKMDSISDDLNIKGYGESIYIDEHLTNKIDSIIDTNGKVKENATAKLKAIFDSINRHNEHVKDACTVFINRHASSLQENNVFMRKDRIVFLIKNADKHKFKGFQYDSSASGLASYVEPEEFIALNNKTFALENEKQEEINKILKELTHNVAKVAFLYQKDFESLIKLDVLFAKAEYGLYNAGCVASFNNEHSLFIKDVAHPLIDPKMVVLNTYSLKYPYKGIVISGTNTGGKTVGLKLIGLSVLMTYLGIPILANNATIPYYENVYIDIDDNQSITNCLSTFSAHISNINKILNSANENSLILIDELISGTDPKEAQAISLSILKQILKIKAYFVITTHYDDIKEFAYNNDSILLSSVGFDINALKPTYKYIENSIGVSNAIDIASRYFDNQEIIKDAKNYLESNQSKQEKLLKQLASEIALNEKLKESLTKKIKKNEILIHEYKQKIADFDKEKALIKDKYQKKLNSEIEKIKEKAYQKLDEINKKDDKQIIEKIDNLKVEIKPLEKENFTIGDRVRIGESNCVGDMLEIDGKKVSVNVKGMTVKTSLDNLKKLPKKTKKEYVPLQRMERTKREINLVGKRVDEALSLLDSYLDNAYGSGLSEVKIIHGQGSGQLRSAIRTHLNKNPIVKDLSNGDIYDGGSNVTMVKFKK